MTGINTLVVGVLALGLACAGTAQGSGQSAPTCFGMRATIVGAGEITGLRAVWTRSTPRGSARTRRDSRTARAG